MKRLLILPLLLSACGQVGSPDVQVTDAWARATAPGQTGAAAYMMISNRGSGDDRLVAISAPAPALAMVHETAIADGVTSMRPMAAGAVVEAGSTLELKPMGKHIMITGLTRPLQAGATLPLTLRFERTGERRVDVQIVDPAAIGPR